MVLFRLDPTSSLVIDYLVIPTQQSCVGQPSLISLYESLWIKLIAFSKHKHLILVACNILIVLF